MSILVELKFLLKLVGLDPQAGYRNIVLRCSLLIVIVLAAIMALIQGIIVFYDDMYEAILILPVLFGCLINLSNYYHLLIRRKKIYSLLDELERISCEGMSEYASERIYTKTEQQISFLMKILFGALISVPVLFCYPFVVVAYHWLCGQYTIQSWIYVYPVWTPFELNSTFRCASVVFYLAFDAGCLACMYGTIPATLIAFMFYSEACVAHIHAIFMEMELLPPNEEPNAVIERCKEAVVLHCDVIRFMDDLADVMNAIVLGMIFFWSMCICSSLFSIEMYDGPAFLNDMLFSIMCTIFPMNALTIIYYLGQRAHSNLMSLNDKIYQTIWYNYPRNRQRFVYLMIMRSQRPYYLSAYGFVDLNLENFVGLLKTIYSAFMVLHNLE